MLFVILFANMNSANTITLPICLCMKMVSQLIPVIPKFRTRSLILKRIRNSHKPWYADITHYPKGYVFIPACFKRGRRCLAVIKKWNSSKYRWKLFGEETVCKETFVEFIRREFIHKICIFFIRCCKYQCHSRKFLSFALLIVCRLFVFVHIILYEW